MQPVGQLEPQPVAAGEGAPPAEETPAAPGIPLYMFE
jgi:hypothetical protein